MKFQGISQVSPVFSRHFQIKSLLGSYRTQAFKTRLARTAATLPRGGGYRISRVHQEERSFWHVDIFALMLSTACFIIYISDIIFVYILSFVHVGVPWLFSCVFAQSLHDDEQKVIIAAGSLSPCWSVSSWVVFDNLDSVWDCFQNCISFSMFNQGFHQGFPSFPEFSLAHAPLQVSVGDTRKDQQIQMMCTSHQESYFIWNSDKPWQTSFFDLFFAAFHACYVQMGATRNINKAPHPLNLRVSWYTPYFYICIISCNILQQERMDFDCGRSLQGVRVDWFSCIQYTRYNFSYPPWN